VERSVVTLFQRSVREVAIRDYSAAQVAAWAPESPDAETWARRLGTGGVASTSKEIGSQASSESMPRDKSNAREI